MARPREPAAPHSTRAASVSDPAPGRLRELEEIQRATLNILEDVHEERLKAGETQVALMNILDDVETERVKAERANAALAAANAELEAFSYSVSHDLRAPLRAIAGFVEAIEEDFAPRLDDEGRRYLGLVRQNAEMMGQLIDNLLDFSRLSRRRLAAAPVDLAELARAVFEEQLPEASEREVRLALGPVPPAYGDRDMLRQVLANLLSNAVKFTRTRAAARIEFGYTPDAQAYFVRDNGVGFDMRYVDKLFGVFQRLHSVSEFEGTGVGLALVHRIVTRHGGRVWAEGQVDRGATFYFTLPAGESQ